jgi:membrane protein DedA with SNARE-associated domain
METIIIDIIEKFGYIGISLLIMIENVFPPIPSEVILAFGGFATSFTKLTLVGVIIAATIGSLLGAVALYWVGRILNKERLEKLVKGKIGKVLRLKVEDIEKADKWFDKKGKITVLFCRCIPILRSLISIPAGMSEMKFVPFLLLTILGSAAWNTLISILGSMAGNNWEVISSFFDKYANITLIILIIGFIVFVYLFYRKRKKHVN